MPRFERCGDESPFYLDLERSGPGNIIFRSPLFIELVVEQPGAQGQISVFYQHLDLLLFLRPDVILKEMSEDEGHPLYRWVPLLAQAVARYGYDPIVLTDEFQSSFMEEDIDTVLEDTGKILLAFARKPTGFQVVSTFFVQEGSPAEELLLAARDRVRRDGEAVLRARFEAEARKIKAMPIGQRPLLSMESIQIRRDINNYELLKEATIVPDARKAAQDYLGKVGAFECASKLDDF